MQWHKQIDIGKLALRLIIVDIFYELEVCGVGFDSSLMIHRPFKRWQLQRQIVFPWWEFELHVY